ncbi:MAG TPA: CoA transferase [Actinomycetales bacterium]|nr:CoA transferase [Actinomycetales bacterium]
MAAEIGADPQTRSSEPLSGLTVVDLSTTLPGAMATQFLADAGAHVVLVEPPAGSPLRALPGWPALGRGKRSATLDIADPSERAGLDALLGGADVVVTTVSPAAAEKLDLTAERFARVNPRLVSAAITGWGSSGPFRDLKGYEALVMAKVGWCHSKAQATTRPGPAFISVPFASWGAAQAAVHGILAALYEREDSGVGQHVESDLVRGAAAHDTWNWFTELIGVRWPGAFEPMRAFSDDGHPQGYLIYPLLAAPTKDGTWLQFAQTDPKLLQALLVELGIAPMLADPKWEGFPIFPDLERREELWEIMQSRVGERTLAEWEQVFVTNRNVSAEPFRTPGGAFDHPQLRHDGRVVTVTDPDLGPVTQVSTLVHDDGRPLTALRPAPRQGGRPDGAVPVPASAAGDAAPAGLPLEGVTVLEFGLMFAAPYGSSLLTDLGARVIKVESLVGDGIRSIIPFPEAGGAKVMQGKQSIALDLGTPEGLAIVHRLAGRADLVLQAFRAGAAERAGVDAASLRAVNPDLIYLNAPGYGTDGPYGGRPAYAPSIGAATGIALTDAPDAAAAATGSIAEKKAGHMRLNSATAVVPLQADGIAALGVGSALLLGLLARRRGRTLGELTTTMMGSATHALINVNTQYQGRPATPTVDPGGHGFSALYRMYPAADGWVMLAAPSDDDWADLASALSSSAGLAGDDRFATAASRAEHDAELAEALAGIFAQRPKAAWESELTAAGVGLVAVAEQSGELTLQSDEWFAAGYSVLADSPVFEEHRRLAPLTRFSRSATKAEGGVMLGSHTDAILHELDYSDEEIADLRERKVIG